jgi:hypothetical protein
MKKVNAGKRGESIRSDCYFEIELKNTGGIKLDIKSKVESIYEDSNQTNDPRYVQILRIQRCKNSLRR